MRLQVRGRALRGLAFLLLSLILSSPALAAPCANCLEAGAARVRLEVPEGTPLGGYGSRARRLPVPDVLGRHPHAFWLQPYQGTREELAARALILASADHRVALVAVDLLAIDNEFTAEVDRRLRAAGVPPGTLIIAASHTHSGPGAFVDSTVFGWLTLDRLDLAVREALLDAVVTAIRQAEAARQPARLAVARMPVSGVARSRLRQPLDDEMLVVRVTTARGDPLALVWNYAIHGTALGPRNLRLSGDVMGEASTRLEAALGVPALFVNGAVGDVSPARHGEAAATELGAELAAVAHAGWTAATPLPAPKLAVAAWTVDLPAARLPLRSCLRGWAPRSVTVPLGSVFPRETALTAVTVGGLGIVTIPGELQTRLGRRIKETAGLPHVLVAGLANGYLGYLLVAADSERPSYVSCGTVYGPTTGECLSEAAAGLLRAVARGEPTGRAGWVCDRAGDAR
jgi:neutral ceramidase